MPRQPGRKSGKITTGRDKREHRKMEKINTERDKTERKKENGEEVTVVDRLEDKLNTEK